MTTTTAHNLTLRPVSWAWLKHAGSSFYYRGLWIPVVFLVFMFVQNPFADAADYDYDEGINLMKT